MTPVAVHVPERTCVACRATRPKADLLRVVREPDGGVRVDASAPGRGAYVCADVSCAGRAARRLAHALRLGTVDEQRIEDELMRSMGR